MSLSPIPQTSPHASYQTYKEEIDRAIALFLERGRYILSDETVAFEEEFATYLGAVYGIGVGSGTDALTLALRACGIGAGAEVITVSHTAIATVAAIELADAVPVLVDIDPHTFTIDPAQIEQAITDRTRVIVPVHLYGHPADMDAVMAIAKRHHLCVIEDCAQAHGTEYKGRKVGSFGAAAAFSFYPTKNLGALGDAGMIVCSDPEIAVTARMLRQYGWDANRISQVAGANSRIDELQSAILRVKLRHLDEENAKRRELAKCYTAGLQQTTLRLPVEMTWATHCYHQYVVRVSHRADLQAHLTENAIGTAVHYPVPAHLQPAYRGRLKTAVSLLHTEQAAHEVLSLPLFPALTHTEADYVIEQLALWSATQRQPN